MGIIKTLGGDRLGAGKKMAVELENYGRSTHNQSKVVRTDQAFATLIPYYCNIGTNGDKFEFNCESLIRTLPTVGPIFGSAKFQVDFFVAPIRLYIGALHNNALGIGMNMQNIPLPKLQIPIPKVAEGETLTNAKQISQDSLNAYLGIRGLGYYAGANNVTRSFQALFHLAYWDIYKNYYSNKQEEVGYVIGKKQTEVLEPYQIRPEDIQGNPDDIYLRGTEYLEDGMVRLNFESRHATTVGGYTFQLPIQFEEKPNQSITATWSSGGESGTGTYIKNDAYGQLIEFQVNRAGITTGAIFDVYVTINISYQQNGISMQEFDLKNVDNMRSAILRTPEGVQLTLNTVPEGVKSPYYENYSKDPEDTSKLLCSNTMVGLGVKTYLSDRFNNWLSTEWIDGVGGINEITAVDVSDGKLTMDSLILQKKIYNLLNRIAISGGTYNDWQEAVFGVKSIGMPESPVYCGGYSAEIVFDEVVSNSASETPNGSQPLGSLAGRGSDRFEKGGSNIEIKCEEPSVIMVIGSITPRIDYSQGNKWWTRLETMNDFHKPGLDQIGFQELLTDEMCASDTIVNDDGTLTTKSVGKQPSWIEYMTETNECFGDFTAGQPLEFMAFNRAYETNERGEIQDATTYIDPTKFNIAFADAKLSAKNFWVQVNIECKARRVMSAKQIPNL